MNITNLYVAYRLIKLFSAPFKEWKAYKLGLIDEKGKIIKKAETTEEKNSFSLFERVILKIKRIITKFTGQSRAMAILSTLALIKEEKIYNILYEYISKETGNDLLMEVNMPGNVVKSFADKTGKSVDEVEKLWDETKKLVKKQYPDVNENDDRFYQLVTGILKKMLKLNEQTVTADAAPVDNPMTLQKRKPDGMDGGIHYFNVDYTDCNIPALLDGKMKYKPWRLYLNNNEVGNGIKSWANSNLKPFSLKIPNGVHIRIR